MPKVISVDPFSAKSIDAAVKELERYKVWIKLKEYELRTRLAAIGADVAKVQFARAAYDGVKDISVRIDDTGSVATIYAEGKAVAFVEFGAGAKYGYGHPMASQLGVGPGTYPNGKGHWDNPKGWYYAHGKKSYGNAPAQAMVQARDEVVSQVTAIAREVFGR